MLQYIPSQRPLTLLQRSAAAQQKRDAFAESWNDPVNTAIRRIRSAMMWLGDIGREADKAWHRENDPVALPPQLAGGVAHPQRVAAVAEFVSGWSADPREPIAPTRTIAEIADDLAVEARAELAAAEKQHQELEDEKRRQTYAELGISDPKLMPAPYDRETVHVFETEIAAAIEASGELDVVTDDDVPDAELPRRKPGRPPKHVE